MWNESFDLEMLRNPNGVAINCRTKEICLEMVEILERFNYRFNSGQLPSYAAEHWESYLDEFCFYVRGNTLYYGGKDSTNTSPWSKYTKCTFYGNSCEFESADDNEMYDFLGF